MTKKEIILVEAGIISQDQLQIIENDKAGKYDTLVNEMGNI